MTAILNSWSTTSADIDIVIFRSAVVENVRVPVGIMFVCCSKLKSHRPAENLRFFHGGCPWFSRSLQVTERAIFMRKMSEHPGLDPLGRCFDRILKFARVAKIFDFSMEGALGFPIQVSPGIGTSYIHAGNYKYPELDP